jgi:hypothetical protein
MVEQQTFFGKNILYTNNYNPWPTYTILLKNVHKQIKFKQKGFKQKFQVTRSCEQWLMQSSCTTKLNLNNKRSPFIFTFTFICYFIVYIHDT